MQAYDSIMYRYFCIEFIEFMLKGKSLLDYTNLFSPNNTKIFLVTKKMEKVYCIYLEQLKKI